MMMMESYSSGMKDIKNTKINDGGNNNNNNNNNKNKNNNNNNELEQVLHRCQELLHNYSDDIEPLLSSAELRLLDAGESGYDNMHLTVRNHINQWRNVVATVQNYAIQNQNQYHRLFVTNTNLQEEISDKEELIKTIQEEMQRMKDNYELQLKGLEALLATNGTKSLSRPETNNHINNHTVTSQELEIAKKALGDHLRRYQQQQIEHERLKTSLQILKLDSTSEMQQVLITINEQLAKKEDELLRLRWIVQDLELDRTTLEDELKRIKSDPMFSNLHLAANIGNSQQYSVDFSKYIDDEDDKKDGKSSNKQKEEKGMNARGNMMINSDGLGGIFEDDAGISPAVMLKMKQALEVAQKMSKNTNKSTNVSQPNSSSPNPANNLSNLNDQKQDLVNKTSEPEALSSILKSYASRCTLHKTHVQTVRQKLSQAREQCKLVQKRLNPLLETDALSDPPSQKLSTLLSLVHFLEDSTSDIFRFVNDGDMLLEQIGRFVDDLLTTLEEENENMENWDSNTAKRKYKNAHKPSLSEKLEPDTENPSRMVNVLKEEQFQSELNFVFERPEEHVKRRAQYGEIISELEVDLKEAQRQCSHISNALRTAHSELSKSTDQNEWMSVTASVAVNTNESLSGIYEALEGSLNEIKTAGALLMENDKQIEGFEEQLNALASTLSEARKEYHQRVEDMSDKVRKLRDRKSILQDELAQERAITERRSAEQARLEEEIAALQANLDQYMGQFSEEATKQMKLLEQVSKEIPDREKVSKINNALGVFQKLNAELAKLTESEKNWRTKYSEASRQLEEMQMRRKYERAHFKKKQDQLQNAFNHEKDLMENKHNSLMERLQDELQMSKVATLRSSRIDMESRVEQLEEALTEAHIQIRDKDEELREVTEALDGATLQMSGLEQGNNQLKLLGTGKEQGSMHDKIEKSFEVGASSTSALRKCHEVIGNLLAILMKHQNLAGRHNDIINLANVKKEENRCSFDMTECKVLLNELSAQLEKLGGTLTERDQAVDILSNRLKINQNSYSTMEKKFRKVYLKFIEIGGDKDEIDTPLSDVDGEARGGRGNLDENKLLSNISHSLEHKSQDGNRNSNYLVAPENQKESSETQKRRASVDAIRAMLEEHEKRSSNIEPSDPMLKEVQRRKRASEHRRSSLTGLDLKALKGEANKIRQDMREVKSDLASRSNQPATEQDIAGVKSLHVPNTIIHKQELEETPANSPTAEAQSNDNQGWDVSAKDSTDAPETSKEEIVAHNEIALTGHRHGHGHEHEHESSSEEEDRDENPGPLVSSRAQKVPPFKHRESNKMTIEELQSMYDDKAQLVEDLQRHIEALRQSRRTEIKTFQDALSYMVERCRQWWHKLLQLCNHLDMEFQQKMAEMNNAKAQSDIKEQNEDWKIKYHRQEKKFHDTLESKNQEIEQLRNRTKELETEKVQGGFNSTTDPHNREEMDLREEIEHLREMLAEQEKEFIDEVDQFETVANQKLQELEKFYRGQITELNAQLGVGHYTAEQLTNMASNQKEIYEQAKLSLAQAREQTFSVLRSSSNPNSNVNPLVNNNDNTTAHNNIGQATNFIGDANVQANNKNVVVNRIDNVTQNDTAALMVVNTEHLERIKQLEVENNLLKQGNEDLTNKLTNFQKGFSDNKEKFQQKLYSYEQTYRDLAQKLQDMAKNSDELRKKADKLQKTTVKHKHKKKKLKEELKEVKNQLQNLQSVQVDIVNAKQSLKSAQQEWNIMKEQFELSIQSLKDDSEVMRKSKVEYVRQTGIEINNLREYIKQLQRQIRQLKETGEAESVMGAPTVVGGLLSLFGR